jgi:hypothetical protein
MALTDPQTVTISAATTPLPRVYQKESTSEYESADGLITLRISHSPEGKRGRSVVRIDHAKMTTDPYKPSENVKVGCSIYTVIDTPPAGYTDAEVLAIWVGFNAQLTASSNAVFTKILGGES